MNKKLLAVAVVGALASPAAFAQTTLYGIFDVGYQHASNYNPAAANHNFVDQGMRDPSRLGVRGSEDLAGGMYAMYGMEFNMYLDTGAVIDVNRLAFVGLGSKAWGELTLGRQYTHLFHTYAVGSAHAYGTFTSGYGWSGTPTRASNAIKYSSPVFSGFSVGAIWSPSGQDAAEPGALAVPNGGPGGVGAIGTKENYWDGAVRWTPGPFGAAVAYGQNKVQPTGAGETTTKIEEVSGNWDNKAFGIYGNWIKHKTDAATAVASSDWKIWNVSGVARFGGVHEVYAMFGEAKDSLAAGEPKSKLYGLVYENVLSKRTRLYVGYGKAKNDNGAKLAPTAFSAAPPTQVSLTGTGNNPATTNVAAGQSPSAFQIGISHSF